MALLETLEIVVTTTRFTSDGTVRVDFRGNDPRGEINLNGYIPDITYDEFFQYSVSFDGLKELVRSKLTDRILGPDNTQDEPTA